MKTKSRNLIVVFLMAIAMLFSVFAIAPLTASAMSITPTPEETPAETIYVGGVALSKGQYVKNGETTATTGEPDWEESGFAFYASSGTFHLSDYEYEGTGYTHDTTEKSVIYSTGKLEVILHGTSSIKNTADKSIWGANGIRTKGNLIIDGPGTITIDAPYAIYGNNLVKFLYGKTLIPDAVIAIEAGGNFVVSGGVLELHSTQPILSGASFISGGSFIATAEQGVFQAAPTISVDTEDEYSMLICTDVAGNNQVAYNPENITQYKYFAVLPPKLTEINSVSVSGVVLPALGGKVGDASYAAATCGTGYFVFDMYVDKLVGDTWVALEDTASIVAGEKYRVFLGIDTEEGYTISADIAGANVLINGQQATEYEIFAYPDYNTIDICYEFSYTATETPITSIAVSNLVLPTAGQTAADWDFNPGMLAFGGNYDFDDCGMQKYTGTEWVPMGAGDTTILTNVKYRFFIELSADEGYFFSPELTSDDVTIGDYDAVLLAVNVSGELAVVAAEFYYEASSTTSITSISVSGADLPEVGETKDVMEFTPDSLTYGGEYKMVGRGFKKYTGTEWVDVSDTESLEYGVKYRVNLVLAPNEGYAFADTITSNDVTFNGEAGIFETLISGVGYASIFYEFSYEAPATDYGITIADKDELGATIGVLITEENYTDVLGDGTVSYNPTTNTLTLNGYVYEGAGFLYEGAKYGINVPESTGTLNIVLKGENVIDVTKTDTLARMRISSIGVYTWETDVVFSGDGSLVISATDGGLFIRGENAQSLEIKGGNITVNAFYSIETTCFKMSAGNLTVNATEIDGDIASAIYSYEFKMTGGNLKITSAGLGVEMWHDSDEDAPPMINGGSFEISAAIAGGAFCYYDYDNGVSVAIAPDLTNYVGAHKLTAGVNADGTGASDYSASNIATYKYVKVEPIHVHDHGTAWKSDASEHWNECSCGDKANKAAHADSDNNGKCDTCDYQMNAGSPNDSSNSSSSSSTGSSNNSSSTGSSNNSSSVENSSSASSGISPEQPESGLSTGAIVGIVIGSVAVVGFGGFAIFWFVIKKKTFAELIAIFKKK